ncbi:MAG: inorganic phosphate transporter [Ignavibacteriaceae bacterium]|nr:inorganic phosphate transporter [Ignavibacteriaceae bacterium]
MDISIWFFISSGLFLGWSLGANNAVGLFGTAVSSKMIKFKVAAIIGGIFTLLGSVISGAGTTNTLTNLGGINAIAGSFTVALSVGISITWMNKAQLPVSASQAVVGAIIGWNIFTGSPTDFASLTKILMSWVASPIVAGIFGYLIFKLIKNTVLKWKLHMLTLDNYTRIGLIIGGALASYSMGANDIANVMGMFASASPFVDIQLTENFTITGIEQLFFLGGTAIAFGIITYGHNVMKTVGNDLYKISPITGFAVVFAEFFVLTLFTSQGLERFLLEQGLPSIPLVPLSATQSFIGAVIGVGLAKDPQSINFKVFGKISVGWVIAPLTAGILSFVLLFFVQNVFEQKIINQVPHQITKSVVAKLEADGVDTSPILDMVGIRFNNKKVFRNELMDRKEFQNQDLFLIFNYAIVDSFKVDSAVINEKIDFEKFNEDEISELKKLHGKAFSHKIDFEKYISENLSEWFVNGDRLHDKILKEKIQLIEEIFRVNQEEVNKKKSNKTLNKIKG